MCRNEKKTETENPILTVAQTAASAVVLIPVLIIEGIFGVFTS